MLYYTYQILLSRKIIGICFYLLKPDFNLTIPVLTANIFLIKSLKNTSELEPFYYRLMDTGEKDEDKEVQERRD